MNHQNKVKWEALMEKVRASGEAHRIMQDKVAQARLGPPKPGYSYIFKRERGVWLAWLILCQHPDDPNLFFIVPEDMAYLEVGYTDYKTDTSVYRYGLGHWITTKELESYAVLTTVEDPDLSVVRKLFHDWLAGKSPAPTEEQDYIEDTEEYQRRTRRIERCYLRCTRRDAELWGTILYEDWNCPGMVYRGTKKDMEYLQEQGGFPNPVHPNRIMPNGQINSGEEGCNWPIDLPRNNLVEVQ